MTLREALKAGEAYLAQREIPDAAIDAWYLLEYVLKREAQIRAGITGRAGKPPAFAVYHRGTGVYGHSLFCKR